MIDVVWGLGGMAGLLLVAVVFSSDRRSIRLRTVLGALGLQVAFAVLVLYWPPGQRALGSLSEGFQSVIDTSGEGIGFLFGPVLPEEGSVFAFQVLPVIIFFASLTAVLYHWRILPRVVAVLGGGLGRLLGTERAESVSAASNIFVGQTEAPLVIRPYIAGLSRSSLFAVMVGGLASVAGSVLVGYSLLGAPLEYLIAASFMAAPGGLLMAKIIEPERREGDTSSGATADRDPVDDTTPSADAPVGDAPDAPAGPARDEGADEGVDADVLRYRNVIDAAATGASDGLRLALTIGAMLLAFISLIALVNLAVGGVGGWFGLEDLTFERILGWIFAPVMSMIGVPWSEASEAGSYLGQKLVLNEFVAFTNFGPEIEAFTPKTAAIITFALTGFANLASLGILLGGLGGLAPQRRPEIASLGLRAVLAATLANLMSAALAGILIG